MCIRDSASGDALGAVAGVASLRNMGLPILAASGVLTASPLATREAQSILDVPVYDPEDLGDSTIARNLAERSGMRFDTARPERTVSADLPVPVVEGRMSRLVTADAA